MNTCEEWLNAAAHKIRRQMMDKFLPYDGHTFDRNSNPQIYMGIVRNKIGVEVYKASDIEDLPMDDFFPATIIIDSRLKTTREVLLRLTRGLAMAYATIPTKGRKFIKYLEWLQFEAPFNTINSTPQLDEYLDDIIKEVEQELYAFPHRAVVQPEKKKKDAEKKPTKKKLICPECGFEVVVSTKMLDKYGPGHIPTCSCGHRFEEEDPDPDETELNDKNDNPTADTIPVPPHWNPQSRTNNRISNTNHNDPNSPIQSRPVHKKDSSTVKTVRGKGRATVPKT